MNRLKFICISLIWLNTLINADGRQRHLIPPIVINTWNFTTANARAWKELSQGHSALDAIELGCSQCELDRCDGTVGWGGSPSESGETTLDAMIMDGETLNVGAVGGLRRVRGAISVARLVLERTRHTLLVGEMATDFALELGFKEESLTSNESAKMHQQWRDKSCQPNFWTNVLPDPRESCGPYKLADKLERVATVDTRNEGHDTIGMVAIDRLNRIASGTSTNGLKFKILGRVGDSPVPGAGSYASRDAGAAAATGDGDVMMRFLLSYQAIANLRLGMSGQEAADEAMKQQVALTGRPYPRAALVVLSKSGSFGAACSGIERFPFVVSDSTSQVETHSVECLAFEK